MNVNKNLEPVKHLTGNIEQKFSWYVLIRAPESIFKRIILEAYFINLIAPFLNEQIDNNVLILFRNSVTLQCKFY